MKKIKLGDAPSFYYSPIWSPDGKKIAYTDKRLNLWYVDLDERQVHQGGHRPVRRRPARPGGLVAGQQVAGLHHGSSRTTCSAVFLYSLEAGKAHQVTDGMSDARHVGVRQGRQVPVLHRQHRRRPGGRLAACRSSTGR